MNRKNRRKLLMNLTVLEAAALNLLEEINRVRTDVREEIDHEREALKCDVPL